MADKEVGALPDASTPYDGTEKLHLVQSGNSREGELSEVAKLSSSKGRHTIGIPAGAFKSSETNGAAFEAAETAGNNVMDDGWLFDAATGESIQASFPSPESSDVSEGFHVQIRWGHPATAANFGVTWDVSMLSRAGGDVRDAAFGAIVSEADTGGDETIEYETSIFGPITPAGAWAKGDRIILQIARDPADGSDTMAVDAKLFEARVLYTTDAETDD
jgi:hypothetical protein